MTPGQGQLRVVGPDHRDILITRSNLARLRGEAGDIAGAIANFEGLLVDRLRVVGPDHPDTLINRSNVAYLRGEAGILPVPSLTSRACWSITCGCWVQTTRNTLAIRGNLATLR